MQPLTVIFLSFYIFMASAIVIWVLTFEGGCCAAIVFIVISLVYGANLVEEWEERF